MTTTIATSVLSSSLRATVQKLQSDMLKAEKEVASGRAADLGLGLGQGIGEAVTLRQEIAQLSRIRDTNAAATVRLEATQASLGANIQTSQAFVQSLLTARDNPAARAVLVDLAKGNLQALTANANGSSGGVFYFGGVNTGQKPLSDYDATPASPAKLSVDAAFLTEFGVSQGSPASSSISGGAMQSFLDGSFASLFDAASWQANWSTASDDTLQTRISPAETVETPVTANADGFRRMASVYVMVAEFGAAALNDDAFRTLIDAAISVAGAAGQDFSTSAAKLGAVQERVTTATERLGRQLTLFTGRSDSLEGVDPYEASTRLTALQTQLETAYALTSRLQNMSLLNYL